MKNVVVDYESYYDGDLSVSEIGLPNYVAQTDAYLVSVVSDDVEFCGTVEQLHEALGTEWAKDPNLQFWAANSNFDESLSEKYGIHSARPWKCVLDLAAVSQLPFHLVGVAKAALGVEMDKGIRDRMKGVRFETLPEAEQEEVRDYCLNDSLRTKELLDVLPQASPIEQEIAAHTRMCNRRGVRIDTERVERDIGYLGRIRHDAHQLIPWVPEGSAPLSYPAFSDWCRRHGAEPPASLDKRSELCVSWIKANPELGKSIHAMRQFRTANSKLEKARTLMRNITPEGILPLELRYCGARHTRRWSSKGFNVQNLDREPMFGEIMSKWPEFAMSPCCKESKNGVVCEFCGHIIPANQNPGIFMREYLIPREGKRFGVLDFSQIEPRCLNWLAGNDELLEMIRAGYQFYEAHALNMGRWKGNPGTMKKELGVAAYTRIKNEALGLGYGMGAARYMEYAGLTAEEAAAGVKNYRARNPKITRMWRKFDEQVRVAALDKSRTLEIEMPTGDFLRHFHIRSAAKGYQSYAIKGDFSEGSKQPSLWGGTLTENVTQRMARDVMAEAVLKLEKAGLPVIFHAHDEVIVELDKDNADDAFKEAEHLMKQSPDWCPDLPLGVEGSIVDRYCK